MKIQCDVCDKGEASVFCAADEAALCDACDHRVHHANKLAGKHHRFSLLYPSPNQLPLCDICQERRAFVFCQQDRAILCRECDFPIHKANEHTQKHSRFLLTGIKLSANSSLYSSAEGAASSANSLSTDENGQLMMKGGANGSTSSIFDYLIDMLPGCHVEDFLLPSSSFGFYKGGGGGGDVMPIWDTDSRSNVISLWVPQAATPINAAEIQSFSTWGMAALGGQMSFEQNKGFSDVKPSRKKWKEDNSFAVPQTDPHLPSASDKRFRALW